MDTSAPGSPFADFPQRATRWQLRTRALELPLQPLLMGIINVTPDSFSDGGRFFDPQAAIEAGRALAAAGASLLDVGGESTRPYAESVDEAEELRRVLPVVQALAEQLDVPISIDTSKARVAREALAAGAEIINDITALAGDAEMLPLAVASRAGLCLMHMQGTPRNMQDAPHYDDVVAEVFAWLAARRDTCLAAGLDLQRLALDPGIGFGKSHGHNLKLLAAARRFHALGCPLVVGHSHKGYIGKVLGDKQADRTAGTMGVSISLALQGVQILRVHDVLAVRQALDLFSACGGLTGQPIDLA